MSNVAEIKFNSLVFAIVDEKVLLKDFGSVKTDGRIFVELQLSGENKITHSGAKMVNSSEAWRLKYVSHTISNDTLKIVQRSPFVEVTSFFVCGAGGAIRVFNEVKNVSCEPIVIEEVSSFVLRGLCKETELLCKKTYFTRFIQSHHAECQPRRFSFEQLGLFPVNPDGQKRIAFANVGSWSTKEELPQGIIENEEDGSFLMFQIESNSSWYYEISDIFGEYYLYLGGANLPFGGWSKRLNYGEKYVTVPVALAFGNDLNEVIGSMTEYRRSISKKSMADKTLPTIFNEYMHLSWDSPSEWQTRIIAPKIANLGIEYYVIDCGWHNEEPGSEVYPYVGQWKESLSRFPNGVKKTTDFIRSLGMKAGLWIEPEIIGVKCEEMLNYYDDSCFLQRNGKRIAVMNRYFLDFRAKKVIDYLSETIRRMVEDYGAEYIKLDYNQDCGVGTDYLALCAGEGLEQCANAYIEWVDEIQRKFPNVLFETCSSGGMRMDYKTLAHFSIVSTSDQTNYKKYPYIAGNVLSAVLPEQAAVWSYPVDSYGEPNNEFLPTPEWVEENISLEQVSMNMINSFLGRMHLASHLECLSQEKYNLVKEGVEYFKSLSKIKDTAMPYLPLGFTKFGEKVVCAGLKTDNKIYLAVWVLEDETCANIIVKEGKSASLAYPRSSNAVVSFENGELKITFENTNSAVFLEIEI